MQDTESKPNYAESARLILEQRAATLQRIRDILQRVNQALYQLAKQVDQAQQEKVETDSDRE